MSTIPMSDELIFKEYQLKCQSLKNDITTVLLVRNNLLALNEKNKYLSKSLLSIKTECELYRSHLNKTLFDQQVAADKQKILSRQKLDEFLQSKKRTKEYYKTSPLWFQLEELMKKNTSLEKECKKQVDLLESTEKQYYKLLSLMIETFQKKVCEFCHAIKEHDILESAMLRK